MSVTMTKEILLDDKKERLLVEVTEHTRTLMDYVGEIDDVDHSLESVIQGNINIILFSPAR